MYVRSSLPPLLRFRNSVPLQELERAAQPLYREQGIAIRDQPKCASAWLSDPYSLVPDPCLFLVKHKTA